MGISVSDRGCRRDNRQSVDDRDCPGDSSQTPFTSGTATAIAARSMQGRTRFRCLAWIGTVTSWAEGNEFVSLSAAQQGMCCTDLISMAMSAVGPQPTILHRGP